MSSFSLLEPSELFVKEVNDHCAEYKAGEDCKKSSNACLKAEEWLLFSQYVASWVKNTPLMLFTLYFYLSNVDIYIT